MKVELYERLSILEEAGLISNSICKYCMETVDFILQKYEGLNEEKLAIFVTHLAMASQRILDNKIENPVDDSILESLKVEESYEEVLNLINRIVQNEVVTFPDTEIGYLKIHLCNLLKVE